MRIEIKATILALAASACTLAVTFSLAPFLQSSQAAQPHRALEVNAAVPKPSITFSAQTAQGRSLFARNCAHCHGDDARGDEGPTLYNLAMSDTRISKRIKEGIKGEMPKFGSKLNEVDIAALIAYLRTLKD